MSSILDALKKLEEEKQRQLKLLEKEETEEQEFIESSPPLPSPKTEVIPSAPLSGTPSFSPKVIVLGIISLIIFLSVISVSVSFLVVKTQIAKSSASVGTSDTTNVTLNNPSIQKETANNTPQVNTAHPEPGEETARKNQTNIATNIKNETKPNAPVKTSEQIQQTPPEKQLTPVPEPSSSPEKQTAPPPPETGTSPSVQSNELPQTNQKSDMPQIEVAKNVPIEKSQIEQQIPKEEIPPQPSPPSQPIAETPVPSTTSQSTPNNSPVEENIVSPPPVETPEKETSKSEPQQNISVASNQAPKENTTPKITTRELEPPPSLKPEQFQQALSLPKPKTEEPIDMTRLPVLRTSDRVRLGLDNMQLNVLREAGPKNPHGLAIINLNKVYVGEIIPGSSARLLDVKTHGIAIEVVGTGERYYVPR